MHELVTLSVSSKATQLPPRVALSMLRGTPYIRWGVDFVDLGTLVNWVIIVEKPWRRRRCPTEAGW